MTQGSQTGSTLTDRAIVRLSGEDVRGFVQGLATSDVAGDLPVWAGLLTAQGKCLFDFMVWADGDDLLLDCETEAADDLIKRLSIYRLRRPVKIERDDNLAVHWSRDGDEGLPDPRLSELGRRWLAPAGDPASGWLEHRLRLGVAEGRASAGVGLRPPVIPRQAGSSIGSGSVSLKAARSSATCSGSNAMRSN